MDKANIQWSHFKYHLGQMGIKFDKSPIKLLEIGCGSGECCLSALIDGVECYGLEVDVHNYNLAIETFAKSNYSHLNRYLCLYDGDHIPFPKNHFDAMYSWYVFEHISEIGIVFRELTRVIKPGGVLYIKWQDPNICYEGHAAIPWLPFMPKYVRKVWCDEFEIPSKIIDYIDNYCYNNNGGSIESILISLGWEIVDRDYPLSPTIGHHWDFEIEEEIRAFANTIKSQISLGNWPNYPNHVFPFIKAVKLCS